MSRRVLASLVVASLWLLASAAGQKDPKGEDPYAVIFGTVVGPDNRPLQGVPVKIRPAEKKKARWEHVSDRRGEFARRVPPGPADYIVWLGLKDSQAAEKSAVKVHILKDEQQDIILHLTEQPKQK
jgi:hypothetical protein